MEVFGSGRVDISLHNAPGMAVALIEGSGSVIFGHNNLTVGGNDLTTTFTGARHGDAGSSLTKVGTGALILRNANHYDGGTMISGGSLGVCNQRGSGTGSGGVRVAAGTLGGTGTIAGAVTVGTRSGAQAVLAPGRLEGTGTLAIQSALTFNSGATYNFGLNSNTGLADKVVANGVTIISGALFSFAEFGNSVLLPGTVFTAIDNTAGTPITGTFSNLADGSTFIVSGNTYRLSYEGGDGNDLTLTVVP